MPIRTIPSVDTDSLVPLARRILLLCLCLAGIGCRKEDPILRYEVPKEEAIQLSVSTGQTDSSAGPATFSGEPTHRMLAAVVLTDKAWFFKGTAPRDAVTDEIAEQFDRLVASLSFQTGATKPSWDLPPGWSEAAPSGSIRVADLRVGDVAFSVTPLGYQGDQRSYLLSNINRWRRQLRLPPLPANELDRAIRQIPTADGRDAFVVDLQGQLDASSLPPMAGGRATRRAAEPPRARFGQAEIQYQTPEGWQELPARQMRKAAFSVQDGGRQAEVTVIALGGSAGSLLPNANRWRDQVGLEALASVEELQSEEIEIDGKEATYLRIEGTEDRAILAAILPWEGQVWFFKLMGDRSLAVQQEDAFRQFLESVRFAR